MVIWSHNQQKLKDAMKGIRQAEDSKALGAGDISSASFSQKPKQSHSSKNSLSPTSKPCPSAHNHYCPQCLECPSSALLASAIHPIRPNSNAAPDCQESLLLSMCVTCQHWTEPRSQHVYMLLHHLQQCQRLRIPPPVSLYPQSKCSKYTASKEERNSLRQVKPLKKILWSYHLEIKPLDWMTTTMTTRNCLANVKIRSKSFVLKCKHTCSLL